MFHHNEQNANTKAHNQNHKQHNNPPYAPLSYFLRLLLRPANAPLPLLRSLCGEEAAERGADDQHVENVVAVAHEIKAPHVAPALWYATDEDGNGNGVEPPASQEKVDDGCLVVGVKAAGAALAAVGVLLHRPANHRVKQRTAEENEWQRLDVPPSAMGKFLA